ncbi:Acyl-CoA N-acyltransferase [Metarhizium guizhouense ARSEF 977]|uniref:Acyl-CoA N-acyltransferase n=1 Tax=Metarhizium guizhouense (strain ARSEF 977) TaxID=1276136 RepID=A0A0B4HLE5_METGA|nr:Acyl-CoA N-acyltransferase [Metarhizium guizhouense ARSEF 977]
MPLKVVAASAEDAARAVAIENLAYGPNPYSAALFPGPFPPGGDDSRVKMLIHQLEEDPACRWVKVVDTELEAEGHDGMIAFSKWYIWETPRDTLPPTRQWGPGTNPEACELFFGGMRREWIQRMASKPHVYLKLLHTDPKHQRRGAGSLLLKWGTTEADRLGLPAYLESSEEGYALYERHGWREVGKLVVDLSKWGGPSDTISTLMLREPVPKPQSS